MPSKQRYDRGDIRRLNAVSVLNVLHTKGSCSRANIAAELGLTRATVSNIVAELIASGLVLETNYITGTTGRPGLLVALNSNAGGLVAVDLDIDRITVVVSNFSQEVIWRRSHFVVSGASPESTLDVALDLSDQAVEECKNLGLNCLGICVGLAGMVLRDVGELAYGPMSGWQDVHIKEDWEKRFSVPVYVENEAQLGALGAHHFGPFAGARNLVYLSLGVGLAAGVFVDGSLLRGVRGFAGQVGHTRFKDDGVECQCGKKGCWVTEIGASAALRKFAEAGVEVPSYLEQGVDWVDWAWSRAEAKDEVILQVIQEIGRDVGIGAASLVQAFNPSVLLIGGRYGKLLKFAESVIEENVAAETLNLMADHLKVSVSTSGEDSVIGCMATLFDATMKNPRLGHLK